MSCDHSRFFQHNLITVNAHRMLVQVSFCSLLKYLQHLFLKCLHKGFMWFLLSKTLSATILHYLKFIVNSIKNLLLLAYEVPFSTVAKVA